MRIVPGGSSIRDGCYLGKGVTCMPPMYINAGAYVGDGTMVDSHALVGSCAQIGKNCHISAAAQIGGVLEPVGALPVIIEDDVLVGGNCGVYEGTVVKKRAVLGTGTILNRSTPVYDLVRDTVHRATDDEPLVIPEERGGGRRLARRHQRSGQGLGHLALHSGDREVSRREDRHQDSTGRSAALVFVLVLFFSFGLIHDARHNLFCSARGLGAIRTAQILHDHRDSPVARRFRILGIA